MQQIKEVIIRKAIKKEHFFVAATNDVVMGVLEIVSRHVESPSHVLRDVSLWKSEL